MSSTSFRQPEFRLYLGYPQVILTRGDRSAPVGTAATDTPAFGAELGRLAAEVARARGRVVAVLPEAEVWRGRADLASRTRSIRRRAAREIVAARLGEPVRGVAVVLGAREPDGSVGVAGVRRSVLAQTHALLAEVGLRPAAVVGAGDFAGFAAPPRLDAARWRLPALPRPPRSVVAAALGTGTIAALAALVLALSGPPPAPPDVASAAPVPGSVAVVPAAEPALRADPRPLAAPPLRLVRSERPAPRPKPLAVVEPVVTVATRNVPLLFVQPRREAVPELRLAELTTARARMIDAMMATPLRRPAAAPALLPGPATDDLRPLRRPVGPAAAAQESPAAPPASDAQAASLRPRPRPAVAEAVVVASLAPAASVAAVPAPPPSRPANRHTASVAPRPVVKAAPVVVKPAVLVVRKPAVAPAPVRQVATPVRQKVVVQKAPVAPTKPTTVAAAVPPTAQKVGLSRGSMSLIGVFGGASERHALVLLPNGAIQRVSQGDRIQGAQVAAVGADSVRLRGSGRDTLLRLPD